MRFSEPKGPIERHTIPSASSEGKSSSEDDSDSEGDEELPLFLRRDIPSVEDSSEAHNLLESLWQARQKASFELVQALNEDNSTLFGELEGKMRRLNQRMHQVLKNHIEKMRTEFVGVDDLPLPSPMPQLRQAYKNEGNGEIQIRLEYEGSQVLRTVKANSPNLDIHHLAIEYLMDVFDQQVESFADFTLTYEANEIHFRGSIDEIPILDGGTIHIQYLSRENRTPRNQPSDPVSSSSCLGGSSRGNHQDETHPLTGARAPSRPGNNGGAYLDGSPQRNLSAGYLRGEAHPLTGARAPSRPGNNGGALSTIDQPSDPVLSTSCLGGSSRGNHQDEIHPLTGARASSRPGNNGEAYLGGSFHQHY